MRLTRKKIIMQRRERYQKTVFFVGALWNWGLSLLFISLSIMNKQFLSPFLNRIPESMMTFYAFLAAVFIFGMGYYWTSKDVQRNRDIIKMGILGKIAVFALFLTYTISGEVTLMGLVAATVDLVFAGLFVEVLITNTGR